MRWTTSWCQNAASDTTSNSANTKGMQIACCLQSSKEHNRSRERTPAEFNHPKAKPNNTTIYTFARYVFPPVHGQLKLLCGSIMCFCMEHRLLFFWSSEGINEWFDLWVFYKGQPSTGPPSQHLSIFSWRSAFPRRSAASPAQKPGLD